MCFRVSLYGMLRLLRVDTFPSLRCWFSRETALIVVPHEMLISNYESVTSRSMLHETGQ